MYCSAFVLSKPLNGVAVLFNIARISSAVKTGASAGGSGILGFAVTTVIGFEPEVVVVAGFVDAVTTVIGDFGAGEVAVTITGALAVVGDVAVVTVETAVGAFVVVANTVTGFEAGLDPVVVDVFGMEITVTPFFVGEELLLEFLLPPGDGEGEGFGLCWMIVTPPLLLVVEAGGVTVNNSLTCVVFGSVGSEGVVTVLVSL